MAVEFTGIREGLEDRCLGDLVKDHTFDRDLWIEYFEKVPRNGLTLTILIRCEIELVAVLQQRLQLLDLILLVRRNHIERLEVIVDIDAHPGPALALVGRRHIGSVSRQVTNVADRGLDEKVVAEILRDFLCFRRALHDHECGHCFTSGGTGDERNWLLSGRVALDNIARPRIDAINEARRIPMRACVSNTSRPSPL